MSVYNQRSFAGGMKLQVDDTRLAPNEYKIAFNCRNRVDTLDPVLSSKIDTAAPAGKKQGILTFGNYVIAFIAGFAYYRYYTSSGWTKIEAFQMDANADRFWFEQVPVALTNYKRTQASGTDIQTVNTTSIAAASGGNLPGLLVQDNINQPYFIYIDTDNTVKSRVTQTYDQWSVDWADYTIEKDKREYVPIGNAMKFVDGVLYIVSQDKSIIYRSVSGRPLDFVINVDTNGDKGGDATTTSYSVGVGGISALHALADGSLFVAASNANFSVSKNMTYGAQKLWGEYTFIRKFLFNATCLDERCILDSLGDTRFIDLGGIRSFNAIMQEQNEGRNSVFSLTINAAFSGIQQSTGLAAAIFYDNYELYSVQTVFGNVIAVYDSINNIWAAFDTNQTGGKRIKQFAKIELSIQRLYAITEDDQIYTLYIGPTYETAAVRPLSISSNVLDPSIPDLVRHQVKPLEFRAVINNIKTDSVATLTTFVDNRMIGAAQTKNINYTEPTTPYTGEYDLPDIDTQLQPLVWLLPQATQGWKCFFLLTWTGGGTLTQFSVTVRDDTPTNPGSSQARVS